MTRNSWLTASFLAFIMASSLPACDRSLEDDAPRDPDPPELVVLSPDRGFISAEQTVTVRGRVRDDISGVETVKVNDVEATVSIDGSFEATVMLPPGVTLLQTVAIDVAGNKVIDTRAAMTGQLAPIDQPVREAMAAYLSDETFALMATITANIVNDMDLGLLAQAANPVFKNGGCLGATIDIDTINKSAVEFSLVPVGGGLAATFSLIDLDVDMDADFKVACIGGSSGLYLNADKFTLTGMLSIKIENGEMVIDMVNTSGTFEGFSLDVGVIPSSVVEFFVNDIDDKIAETIAEQVDVLVPQMAGEFLDKLTGDAFELEVSDKTLSVSVTPTIAEFSPMGGTIALDSDIRIKDAFGPGYIFTPSPMPTISALQGAGQAFRFAMADDAINQILASMHASGMLELGFDVGGTGGKGFVDRIDVHMLLPPVFRADLEGGSVEIVVGDMLVDFIKNDLVITRAAISGRLQLHVAIMEGRLALQTSAPELWVDLVDDGVSGTNPLSHPEVEALASIGIARMASILDGILAGLPIPTFAGTSFGDTTFEPSAGYMVIGGVLEQAP